TVSNAASVPTADGVQISDVLPGGFSYASTGNVALNGGATRPSTSDPTAGATTPSWGTFSLPAGGSVAITFTVNVASSVTPGTYQNPASATSTTAGAQITNYDPASSTAEDVTVTNPGVLTVTKTTSTAKIGNKPNGGTATYTITVSNGAQAPTANGVQI